MIPSKLLDNRFMNGLINVATTTAAVVISRLPLVSVAVVPLGKAINTFKISRNLVTDVSGMHSLTPGS